MFVWMIFSISERGVSANGTGISWDAPTLFTICQPCSLTVRDEEVRLWTYREYRYRESLLVLPSWRNRFPSLQA